MKRTSTLLATVSLASLTLGSAFGSTLIIGDDFDVTGSGSGFNLGSGVNSEITDTSTRLTGTMASGLRYVKFDGSRANNLHYITNNAKFGVSYGGANSLISLSPDGTAVANFGPALNTTAATPDIPSVYEVTISMANMTATGNARCSFGISSANGLPQTWDFGVEIFRNADTETAYTIQKRIDVKSNGGSIDTSSVLADNVGTFGQEVSFLFRVTDAGPESTTFSSRLELAILENGTTNWIYDTQTDFNDLPYGWRFSGAGRFLYLYNANTVGPVTFDNLALNSISRPTDPMVRVWTGGGVDDNWSTGANWGGEAPNSGDWLIFGSPVRQNNMNNLPSLLTPWLAFTNGGFVLSGNEWKPLSAITNLVGSNTLNMPLVWQGTAGKTWHLAPDTDLTLAGSMSIELNGDHTFVGGGTLRVASPVQIGSATTANPPLILADGRIVLDGPASQVTSRGGLRIGASAAVNPAGPELVLSNGASVYLTLSGAACRVGNTANGAINRLIVDHSTFTSTGGEVGVPWSAGATGEVIQVGGLVTDCNLNFNRDGDGVGTYTLKDGVLEPRQIGRNSPGGSCSMYFDNATLRTASSANSTFMAALDVAEIQSGGLKLDVTAIDVELASPFSGAGALTKSGSMAAVLTGINSYAGNTVVQEGKLVLPTTQTNSAAIQVADGAQFGVVVTKPGTTLTAGSLSLSGSSSSPTFDLGTFSNPTSPLMQVGSLSASGTVTVNVTGGSILMSTGTVRLITYSSLSGSPTFVTGSMPSHLTAHVVNNVGSVDLVITGAQGYRWTGAVSSDWDTMTQNWINEADGQPAAYMDGFKVDFGDGVVTGNVTLPGSAAPLAILVSNNEQAYTLSGGSISTALLVKDGTNSLTRVDGGADLISGIELNEGSFIANATSDADFNAVLTDTSDGLGTFIKEGDGVLSMLATNSMYDGDIIIRGGTFKVAATDALGSTNGATIITNGASLDVNNMQSPHEPVIVSGDGVNGQGAIVNLASAGGVQNNLTDVTMMGDTTFGCVTGGRWDIRVRNATGPGPGLRGNGYNLTKVGGGTLSISAQRHTYGGQEVPYWEMNLGDILVSEGSIAFEESISLGNPEKSLVMLAGTTMNFFDLGLTNPLLRTITITDGSLTCGGQVTHTNMLNGAILMTGAISMRPNNANFVINGDMSGEASLTIGANPNPGIVILNGVNTYTGDTTVSDSTLAGNGSIVGNLIMAGGICSPGYGVGTFTVNGNATLSGTTRMELAPGETQNSDQLSVGGTITAGGDLVVVFSSATAPAPGEVFQLFNKGVSGFATVSLPDLSGFPGGLTWDQSELAVNGSVKISGGLPPAIGNVSVDGGLFSFSGTGGTEGATYYIVTSPDVGAPMSSWIPVATNVFGAGGSFNVSIDISGGGPEAFFRLQIP